MIILDMAYFSDVHIKGTRHAPCVGQTLHINTLNHHQNVFIMVPKRGYLITTHIDNHGTKDTVTTRWNMDNAHLCQALKRHWHVQQILQHG
jgi:hypothetical protein